MNNVKNIKNNFLFSMISQVVTISLGMIVPRFVLVSYGSEINGLLASVTQFLVCLSLFESGIQQVALKSLYKPLYDENRQAVNGVLSAVHISYQKVGRTYFLGLLLLSLVYPLFVAVDVLGYWEIVIIILFSGMGNVVQFYTQGKYRILLQADGKNYILINTQTIISVLSNVFKIVFLSLQFHVVAIIMVNFLISFLQAVYICIYIRRNYSWIDLRVEPDYRALDQKNAMLVHQIAALLAQYTDIFLITIFCGLKTVSVYSVYRLVFSHIWTLLSMIYNSFGFYLGQRFHVDKGEYIRLHDAIEVYHSAVVVAVYSVTMCLIIPFVNLYTDGISDTQYVDSLLAVLFVSAEVLAFMRLPMQNTINYAGAFRRTLPQTITEIIIHLMVSGIGVIVWGIHGAVLGTVISYLYRAFAVIVFANRELLDRHSWKTIFIYFVAVLSMLLIVEFYRFFNVEINSWFAFLKAGIIWTPIALVVNFVLSSLVFPKEAVYAGKIIRKMIG